MPGQSNCPKCGTPLLHALKTGKVKRPEGQNDYFDKVEEYLREQGRLDIIED